MPLMTRGKPGTTSGEAIDGPAEATGKDEGCQRLLAGSLAA